MSSEARQMVENERQQVENRLRERERFLRTLIGNLPGVVYRCRVDSDFSSEFISDGCFKLTGYTADELTRLRTATWDDIIHPEDRERVRGEVRGHISDFEISVKTTATTAPLQTTYRILMRDESLKYVRDRFRLVIDTANKVVALEGFIADITERTVADERLRESESRYRLLAENMRDLVCLHKLDGEYIYVSPSAKTLLGYDPNELIGVSPYSLIHEEDAGCVRDDAHAKLLAGETDVTLDYRIRHKSGEYIWLETMAHPVLDENNRLTGLQTVSRDISKRKAIEQERAAAQEEIANLFLSEQNSRHEAEAARREAEHANRVKDEFLQMVSHEFRTPLTTIKTLARVLQKDGETPEERREYLETIAAECDRQIDMILNLLDVARIEEGSVDLRSEPIDINRVLRSCDKIERHAAVARGQMFNVEYDDALPPVRGDEKALRRAICALIENAIKYTPENGMINVLAGRASASASNDAGQKHIAAQTSIHSKALLDRTNQPLDDQTLSEEFTAKNRDSVAVMVCDTGRGIHPDDIPRLFQKFFRGSKPVPHTAATDGTFDDAAGRAETPGVGLGLYLTQRLVKELGGWITVSSEVGRGSCFTIFLPVWNDRHRLDQSDEYNFDPAENR